MNSILQAQSEEISRINVLLEHDNIELKSSVEKVTRQGSCLQMLILKNSVKFIPIQILVLPF